MGHTTAVLPCTCEHAWQDKRYGKGKRLHNALQKGGSLTGKWRCTVCGRVHHYQKEEG